MSVSVIIVTVMVGVTVIVIAIAVLEACEGLGSIELLTSLCSFTLCIGIQYRIKNHLFDNSDL